MLISIRGTCILVPERGKRKGGEPGGLIILSGVFTPKAKRPHKYKMKPHKNKPKKKKKKKRTWV